MADALYLLTLRMTEKVAQVMNEEDKKMVKAHSLFLYVMGPGFYNPIWWTSCIQIT